MPVWGQILFEAVKLLAQFAGAIAVARLAVAWALSRYKAEKIWERRLSAYADAVSAISEMRRVNLEWFDEAIERQDRAPEKEAEQRENYWAARRKVEEVITVGLLLLPSDTQRTLTDLQTYLANEYRDEGLTLEETLDAEAAYLNGALSKILSQARPILEVASIERGR